MDIYDFDGTLYEGDSTADFLKYCVRRYPRCALTLPRTAVAALACLGFHAIDKTQFKQELYKFLPKIPHVERVVQDFWQQNERKIQGPCHPKPGDLVISASPEFLLDEMCKKRDLELIASKVDPVTGNVLGPNCSGEEKIVRLHELYPDTAVENFYSDSHNDDPLAALAQCAYFVKDGQLHPWP